MNTEILDVCKERATTAYLRKAGFSSSPVGFDPTIIITIITTLLSLCKKPAADIKASATAASWKDEAIVKSQVRAELRRRHGLFAYGKFNGDAIASAIMTTAAESSEAEIQAMCECCCG